jgi:acyl carrier protein
MSVVTRDEIRRFLLERYADAIADLGLTTAEIDDGFDFLLAGVIDSFGILEMIGAIEDQFQVRLDMAALDAEEISILGSLSTYVAQTARPV